MGKFGNSLKNVLDIDVIIDNFWRNTVCIQKKNFYYKLLTDNHYEKFRTANAVFSLAQKPLTTGRYLPVQPIAKEHNILFVKNKGNGEVKKEVYIFISKIFTNGFLKVNQPLHSDVVSFQEAFAK